MHGFYNAPDDPYSAVIVVVVCAAMAGPLVYTFAAACLVWVFHDVHPRQLLATMSVAKGRFVALAILIDILTSSKGLTVA